MDETTKMLMRVPPLWDLAEKHAQANGVSDRAKLLIKETKGGADKCQCC